MAAPAMVHTASVQESLARWLNMGDELLALWHGDERSRSA